MRGITLLLIVGLCSLPLAAPAAVADGGDVCVTKPGPDPHKGDNEVCVATAEVPNEQPICYYDPHPPHQTCLT